MAKRGLSIEIGVNRTKVCEIDFHKPHPKVYRVHTFDTPEGAVEDGYIRDKQAYAQALKKELAAAGMRGIKSVIYTLASSTVANREITIPPVKDKRLDTVLRSSAQDYFPIDISEYTLAYTILERDSGESGKDIRVMLFVAPDKLIENYYSFSDEMGFKVEAIDYVGNSSVQLLRHEVKDKPCITVQINRESATIQVFDKGNLIVQRNISYGMLFSMESLMDNEIFDVTSETDAYQYLINHDVLISREDLKTAAELAKQVGAEEQTKILMARENVTETLRYHISNIQRLIDYYQGKYPDSAIEEIYLTGPGANIRGITALFSEELGIATTKIQDLHNVAFTRQVKAKTADVTDYLSVIGATVEPLGFDLKSAKNKESAKEQTKVAKGFLAASIVVSIAMSAFALIQYQQATARNIKLTQRVAELEPVELIYQENEVATNYYANINQMYFMTKTGNERLGTLIEELEARLPVNTMITSFSATDEGVTMNLETSTKISAAWLLIQLNQVDLLTDAAIPAISSSEEEDGTEKFVYSIVANYSETALLDDTFEQVAAPVAPVEETTETTETTDDTTIATE
jgi:type IV pilus assembly protein PilM